MLLSRRALFATGLGAAAAIGVGRGAEAQTTTSGSSATAAGSHAPRARHAVGDLALLVERTTYGYRADVAQEAQTLGYQAFLERQLDPASIDDSATTTLLQAYPTLTMSSKTIWDTYGFGSIQTVISELQQAAVLRAVRSKRQLFERMVEFWSDHFSIDHRNDQCMVLKTQDDRDVIRAHALGKFPELLSASAHSAAMLFNLDNHTNKSGAPNENYARELLELHTLGVGNYTEQDIKELARCLTGWTLRPRSHAEYGAFHFEAAWHDGRAKSVLGTAIPAGGGTSDGETVLALLGAHPQTARFVGRKLARYLLVYEPSQTLVDAVAAKYLATGGDVEEMIRVILAPGAVETADTVAHPKLRRPHHFVCSILRATDASVTQHAKIVDELAKLGHAPFAWLTPDGYPDSLEAWGSALLPRWSFAERLFGGSIAGASVDVAGLLGNVAPAAIAARIDAVLTGGALDPADVEVVQSYVSAFTPATDARRREAFALAASSPSYQYF